MNIFLNKIKKAIESDDQKSMEKIALDFEEELLDKEIFPQNYFDFLIELFSDEKFCSASGADEFVWIFFNEYEKLNNEQSNVLFKQLTTDFTRFKNKQLLMSIVDFIVRKYSPASTISVFRNTIKKCNDIDHLAVLFGSQILAVNKKTSEKEKSEALSFIDKINAIRCVE